jgi:hypothetical protein
MNYSPFKLKLNVPDYLSLPGRVAQTDSRTAPTDKPRRDPYTLTKYTQQTAAQFKKAGREITGADKAPIDYQGFISTLTYNQSAAAAVGVNKVTTPTEGKQSILNDPQTLYDIASQATYMAELGELTLLINPSSFSISHNKLQSFDQMVRNGNLFQSLLGNDLPQITGSGRIGGYYIKSNEPKKSRGFCFFSREESDSWKNFSKLFNFYMNNGLIMDVSGNSRASHHVGYVSIFYDGWEYQGSFDSFGYGFAETEMHGGLSWDFTFTVSRMIHNPS